MHGGRSPAGAAHPRFRVGYRSKHLPARLVSRYLEAGQDEELLAIRDDLALLEARLADLLSRVEAGESGAVWEQLLEAWAEMGRANRAGNAKKAAELFQLCDALIRRGHADFAAWKEIGALLQGRRRLIETEMKRMIAAQQMVTVDEAMSLIHALGASVREHVQDRAARAAIQADITRFLGGSTEQAAS